jgi:hypothetical protein
MDLFYLFAVFLYIAFGTFVLTRNLKSRISWTFFAILMALSFDVILTVLYDTSTNKITTIFLRRLDWIFLISGNYLFFYLSLILAERKGVRTEIQRKGFTFFVFPVLLIILLLHLTTNVVFDYSGITKISGSFFNWDMKISPVFYFVYCGTSLVNTWMSFGLIYKLFKRSRSNEEEMKKARLLTIGSFLSSIGISYYIFTYYIAYFVERGIFA